MEGSTGDDRPCRSMGAHKHRISRIDDRPVIHINDVNLHIDQVMQSSSRRLEHRLNIGHRLYDLGLYAVGESLRAWQKRQLAGNE